jgi:hypothetical protein
MNRSLRQISRAPLLLAAALGIWVAALVLLAPSVASAEVPYQVQWLFTEENVVCETADLKAHDGDPFFSVNDTPLPTHQIAGALVTNADGSESNAATADFDSVLLSTGDNNFLFHTTNTSGDNSCVHQRNVVSLVSAPLGLNKPLFNFRRDGTAFIGNSKVNLGLAEINPPLARDIVNLETVIADNRVWLIDHAADVENLAAKLSVLQQLDTELRDLVTRPLDEIAMIDLDAILDRYGSVVDAATKAALDQLIVDLKQSVVDLENELASLIDTFGAQADAVADLATKSAREAGFNPDDPASYALGASDIPWVEVPDISGVPDAFSPGNDPYAAYADKVIATLAADVSGGKVTARADFVANVRAWRANEAALQQALAMRASVSQAETNAFLNGLNSVTGYVKKFMDQSDWFLDASAPPALRAYVDGVLKQGFADLSDEMKDNLNIRGADTIDLSETQLYQTILAFGGAMSTIGDGVAAYADVMQTLVTATSRIGLGFVPIVGPALDLCECVTGKAWCLPMGKELSTEERIFSGAGVAIGSIGHYYAGVKNAGVSPAAALIAGEVAQVDEAIAKGLHANPRTWYKTLRGAIGSKPLNEFEIVAGRSMQEQGRALLGIGDDGVRRVLGMKGLKAADFLSMTKGGKLVVSEVKGGVIEASEAVEQLTSTMQALAAKGLAGDVERVEIIVKNGAAFKDPNLGTKDGYLIEKLTGVTIEITGFKMLFIKVVRL